MNNDTVEKLGADGPSSFDDQWYRQVVEASGTLVWACDTEGRFTYLNQAWEKLLGYRTEEMLGCLFSQFQRPEFVARDMREFSRHLKGSSVMQYHTCYVAKDGRDVHLIFNAEPLLDRLGIIAGTHGTAIDNDHKDLEDRVVLIHDEFETFFTLIPEMACIASSDGHFKKLNLHWEKTLGYGVGELLGSSILALVHPDDLQATLDEMGKQLQGVPSSGFVNRFRHQDGSYRFFEWQATPARGDSLYAVARDVTEQKRMHEALRLEERRNKIELKLSQLCTLSLKELLDLVLDEVISFSESRLGYLFEYDDRSRIFTVHAWSRQTLDLCAVTAPATQYRLSEAGVWGDAVRLAAPVVVNDLTAAQGHKNKLPPGHVRLQRFMSVPVFSDGRIAAVVGVADKDEEYSDNDAKQLSLLIDRLWQIICRKKAETELFDSRERLRQLAAHTESVREEERLKISREVHDELGQMLSALKFDIAGIGGCGDLPQSLNRMLNQMDANVSAAIASVQRISAQLRPKLLDDLGLVSALEWQIEEFCKRTPMTCRLRFSDSLPPLTPECAITIFRIFQEALTNIQRHSGADLIEVELRWKDREVVLSITDNGRGIRDRQLFSEKSFGLMGMHERARSCSGKLFITGKRGSGTTVRLQIPVRASNGSIGETRRTICTSASV